MSACHPLEDTMRANQVALNDDASYLSKYATSSYIIVILVFQGGRSGWVATQRGTLRIESAITRNSIGIFRENTLFQVCRNINW